MRAVWAYFILALVLDKECLLLGIPEDLCVVYRDSFGLSKAKVGGATKFGFAPNVTVQLFHVELSIVIANDFCKGSLSLD